MNRELIENRAKELKGKQQEVIQALQKNKAEQDQLIANAQLIEGAIADCQFWLSQLPEEKPELVVQECEPVE